MYRTHTNGALNLSHKGERVELSGWVQGIRDKGFLMWIDLRDRYGITQLVLDEARTDKSLFEKARKLGREFVIKVSGEVLERESKNPNIPTGEIEILIDSLEILNAAKLPPFTIENETDGGDELRMKYRYLDIRRNPLKNKLIFRHQVAQKVRQYLSDEGFVEVETPVLIKSTPEGARDFVVPSRMNPGQFYALPQSPQTFKQLLMVGGLDKYFQIVKCFRDEDLRADRQPEFTQIDCEMSFVEQEDILNVFEGLTQYLLKDIKGLDVGKFPRMSYQEAMKRYGNDKPDIRFGMEFCELNEVTQHKDFKIFNEAELVVGINVKGCADYTRKQIDELTNFVKRPQIGAAGMVWVKYQEDGTYASSVNKFYDEEDLKKIAEKCQAEKGDLILILSGDANKVRPQLSALRMELGNRLGLRKPDEFAPLWVVDFPLLEWDDETGRYHAMHHPFTSPKPEDIEKLKTAPGEVRANAYDLVLNGNEIGGGSIRIFNKDLQSQMFELLGFTDEEAKAQFGFLMNAFEYGAPPHGGIAFGFDRLVSILDGSETIRDYIAFPKNNSGRDVMIDAPAPIAKEQLDELFLDVQEKKAKAAREENQ
ncbi:aspartate--tRNA ligase [Ornithobacterium rhinotracheale]|uniref:Aspartate--tRNA ligase n=1 Tax=Ornithobacterium rhinotracheale (strain ATCC 51463 / DSM 15997 / CCUG 23171 / CIP 104009 / LMG 9086) TaxID=867902 RepID=I3ZXB9_ORNRL|nr:aspartate--tRNA ligase [Ornithobacterium rhinotracheale]AFL96353.1 aspartyl-tRNA synthetase [Ornithobacterium rhinotracheale DSM 15997]AIP98590.1 aspartyl-tRNA synthetase [Ornithobacterium rhinotracheale ORT-UMN 88]KGB67598.1 aspartyl-tRNA synthetase [Ornithobacterium rhinotracheale H06-030791]MCK0194677.1 aspartate--tRNA ligase [Ornithobacterium rhinotracheale]MCK0202343.1 aspartate--tRNA ligase [Ornithobacterium rhinotracheale]